MATKKVNNYIDFELEWLENKAKELKAYVDSNPFDSLEDRLIEKRGVRGTTEEIAATIETQLKALTQAMKDFAQIIEVIEKLREKEEAKIEARGGQTVSSLAKDFLQNRT